MKDINKAIEEDFDFGFSAVDTKPDPDQSKAERMLKLIEPLLKNLMKDADTKEYIHWPNRAGKINEFHEKLKSILDD